MVSINTIINTRSKQVRRDTIKLSKENGGYHYGGSFSAVEILICLYDHILSDEDKFILSKGHACWPYYVLLREKGYRPKLEGHPTLDERNGVHFTTGSEGHGLPAGIGMAMARKIQHRGGKIYVLMGDGECQEGTTWESMLIAAHRKLNNLVVIVDWNRLQGSGFVNDILQINGLGKIAELIGWNVEEIDGHDQEEICNFVGHESGKPRLIIARTIKGKGISYMENKPEWHAKWPDDEHVKQAYRELSD